MKERRPGIYTPRELSRLGRRLDRHINKANAAFDAMGKGAVLRLSYERGARVWSLGGEKVSPEIADILTRHALVVPVGDALFPEIPGMSQTWRLAK